MIIWFISPQGAALRAVLNQQYYALHQQSLQIYQIDQYIRSLGYKCHIVRKPAPGYQGGLFYDLVTMGIELEDSDATAFMLKYDISTTSNDW